MNLVVARMAERQPDSVTGRPPFIGGRYLAERAQAFVPSTIAELRNRIGVVFQDFVRFQFTAAENIAMGRVEAAGDRDRIEQAADRSLADAIIDRLPLGLEQPLGRRFSNGIDLSGGEWQKIAIARAYLRDADV
jgi:ATP-binding cassette, subfamily B, bacterial